MTSPADSERGVSAAQEGHLIVYLSLWSMEKLTKSADALNPSLWAFRSLYSFGPEQCEEEEREKA
jgi:hypothetical protein